MTEKTAEVPAKRQVIPRTAIKRLFYKSRKLRYATLAALDSKWRFIGGLIRVPYRAY